MSHFNGAKLRQLRETRRLSMSSVFQMTGVSVSSISNIETGKTDPRMSTVTQLLSCYGASLSDLETTPPVVVGLDELKQRSQRAATDLMASELGPSDPEQRLAHKSMRGFDTSVELDAVATRR
ncbi:MAG: helix-turn-helix domain-containing protein [Acidimicrobiia bacterium]